MSWGWLCWLVALLWGLAGVSRAAAPEQESSVRHRRKAAKVRAKGDLKADFEQARKEAKGEPRAPTSQAPSPQRKRQDITLAVIDDQIGVMKQLLETAGPDDKQYPDYLFQFADLHLSRKAILEDKAGALYEDIYALKEAGKKEAARLETSRQEKLQRMAKESSKAAVKLYGALARGKRWSKYKRMDEALYYLAFEQGELGRETDMQETFVRLLRDYPTSRFVPQVYISFGDRKFGAGQVDEARRLYETVIEGYPDSPVYAYALYKSAWCDLNPVGTGDPNYPRSLQRFVDTIKATLEGRAGGEANGAQLRRDARRDLVLAYAHAGRPSRAWEFFRKVGRGPTKDQDMAREMMARLASTYFGEGMYVESTAIYHRLKQELPKDPQRCEWQYRVVINALATDDKGIQWKETERLGQEWARARDSKLAKAERKQCRDHTRDTLKRMATVWHEEGDKTRRPETFELAHAAYQEYLRLFPKGKGSYDMEYWHGELLWQQAEQLYSSKDRDTKERGRAKFKAAHDAFVRVLERKPKGKWSGEAAYAQMLGMKNYLEYDETGGKAQGCKPQTDGTCVYETERRTRTRSDEQIDASARFPVIPYSEEEELMLAAYARYEKHAGAAAKEHPGEAPKILYHRGLLMVEHHRFDEARPVLERLVTKYDGSIFAVWGGEMLIDVLTIRWADQTNQTKSAAQALKASVELDRWVRKLQGLKLHDHAEAEVLRGQLPTLLVAIGRRIAQAHHDAATAGEDPEGYAKCADQYMDVYEEFEDNDRSDELLFNGARCFEAAYQMGNAIRARKALLERHPRSTLAKQTLREVGENYHAIAFYGEAAERYEQFAARYSKDKFAGDALENAFLFRLGLGQQQEATADLDRYEALYRRKDPKRAAGIFWAKHDMLDEPAPRLQHAREYIRVYGKRGGTDRLVVAHATAGQVLWRQSCPKSLVGDVCVSVRRERATAGEGTRRRAAEIRRRNRRSIPERCGQATHGVVTVYRRDGTLAARAQEHFAEAIRLAGKAKAPQGEVGRLEALRDAVGLSMVYRADARYEEYLRIEMPEELDFYLEEWKKGSGVRQLERQYRAQLARVERSRAQFKAFYDGKSATRDELIAAYGKVTRSKSPQWVLAAAARSAVVFQNFADQLYRAKVPRSIKTQEAYDDYCFSLADYAEPLEAAATKALGYCLDRSTEYQFFNEFSRMCEEELQQREPERYPAVNELFGRSSYTHARMDAVGVQQKL